jgi:hypothetical protein
MGLLLLVKHTNSGLGVEIYHANNDMSETVCVSRINTITFVQLLRSWELLLRNSGTVYHCDGILVTAREQMFSGIFFHSAERAVLEIVLRLMEIVIIQIIHGFNGSGFRDEAAILKRLNSKRYTELRPGDIAMCK